MHLSTCAAAGIVYTALIAPLLPPLLALLRHAASRRQPGASGTAGAALGSRAVPALLRLLGFVIEVFGAEIGTQGLEQLLGGLVEAFATGGGCLCFVAHLTCLPEVGGCGILSRHIIVLKMSLGV